jgi:hypothetical protein
MVAEGTTFMGGALRGGAVVCGPMAARVGLRGVAPIRKPPPMADADDEEHALAHRDETAVATADAYEREYMKGEGLVLYRDKQRTPWPMTALLGGLGVVSLLPLLLGAPGAWLSAVITLPLLFVVWVLMGVLRVTVSQGAVDVQYGVFGPKIPIAAIESVAPTEYKWTTVGGWGIRRGPGGSWVYNMPGDGGRAVKIDWRDAKGRRKVTLIGSRDHHALARAIAQARRALPGGGGAPAVEGDGSRGRLRASEPEREGEGEGK